MFITMIETQFEKIIKICCLDLGEEFFFSELNSFFNERGILPQQSCSGTPEQNGTVERNNHHIGGIAQTLLIESNVPSKF